MYIVGRAINGISINGKEYLLDRINNIRYFETIDEIFELLKKDGYTAKEIEDNIIIEEEE